jgi:hypothetical protein
MFGHYLNWIDSGDLGMCHSNVCGDQTWGINNLTAGKRFAFGS